MTIFIFVKLWRTIENTSGLQSNPAGQVINLSKNDSEKQKKKKIYSVNQQQKTWLQMTIFAVWKHSWKQHAMKLIMELKKQNDLIVQT